MNLFDMVLALFAVMLFTSIALNYNRHIQDQNDLLINATQYVQATQLCHTVLDEIDAKLFARMMAFNHIISNYNNTQRTIDLNFPGDTYQLTVEAVSCDSLGVPLTVIPVDNIFRRVRVTATTPGLKFPVTLQRVYTKTHLNL
ncbi:MAG: hypothetical protein PHN71_00055 [Candidatus Cloacimonetes bacterium]|jgi:hypothetical protein|nr:hypothetical protein [Candidatus Cloacimonadota bacterium]MDY0298501.1 hypothetical protein [Candidatus Cloacimonadaceae bacterium]MCB5278390.1 hypothetical protein [Candidatus Cloacimonadota bacterium]MCK9332225.1 hypothetical protein [Candidatus Cloacimonadota bacterium]MDD2209701.1 hypothetical protein [Candidatus Cloacimonadota bacterium]